jgi:hypothetical protein
MYDSLRVSQAMTDVRESRCWITRKEGQSRCYDSIPSWVLGGGAWQVCEESIDRDGSRQCRLGRGRHRELGMNPWPAGGRYGLLTHPRNGTHLSEALSTSRKIFRPPSPLFPIPLSVTVLHRQPQYRTPPRSASLSSPDRTGQAGRGDPRSG